MRRLNLGFYEGWVVSMCALLLVKAWFGKEAWLAHEKESWIEARYLIPIVALMLVVVLLLSIRERKA